MNRVKETFLLVQSLSKGERNRVSRNLETNSNLYKLFSRLKKSGLTEKELDWKAPYDKNDAARDLIVKIAESMQNFRYANPKKHKECKRKQLIQWFIMDAQFFYDRNIFRLCKQRLLAAEEEAKSIYAYTQLLTIYSLLLELKTRTIGNQISSDIDEGEIIEKINKCQLAVKEYTKFRAINIRLFEVARQRLSSRNKEMTMSNFEEVLNEPPSSNLAIQRYYQAQGVYYLLINQPQDSLKSNMKAREWWEMPENEAYKKEERYQYLFTLNNNAQSCIAMIANKVEETSNLYFQYKETLEETLTAIEANCEGLREDEEEKIKAAYYKNRINQFVLSKQYAKVESLIDEGLLKHRNLFDSFNIKDKIVLLCQYAAICFRLEKYEKSFCQIIECYQFSEEDTSIRKDLVQNLYLLEGVIYTIWKEVEDERIQKYWKNKSPIEKSLDLLKINGPNIFVNEGLELLQNFNTCLPRDRRRLFQPFAEYICQHTKQPFALDIVNWLQRQPLSSGLTKVASIRL